MKLQLAAGAPDPAQLRKFFLSLVSAASHGDSREGLQNYFKFHEPMGVESNPHWLSPPLLCLWHNVVREIVYSAAILSFFYLV